MIIFYKEPIKGVHIIQGDFNSPAVLDELSLFAQGRKADVILSDMLGNATGHKETDHFRSIDLCVSAVEFSLTHLIVNGNFLCKFLRGKDDKEIIELAKTHFHTVKLVKPKASRAESNEIYLLALKKKNI
jgi:23S rRNA (uridine2552-2'-O)-methyltransferase